MKLASSLPFDSAAEDNSFFDQFPSQPAVFALFLRDATRALAPPYLARTTNLERRLKRLLGPVNPPGPRGTQGPTGPANAKPGATARRGPSSATAEPGVAARGEASGAPAVRATRRISLRDLAWRVDYQPVGSNFEARWLLYQLNKAYYPRAYRQRLRLKPPALLKVNLGNRFPRCYPTRRISRDSSLYYGPFSSRLAAERFAAAFLDLFKMRRCVEDLDPDPAHPGCIYSQMRMCLAPCFQGCTDAEYSDEVSRVVAFLDSEGRSLAGGLEAEREQASAALDFEQAAKTHRRLEKVEEVLRLRPGLARNLADLNAVIVERGAAPKSVVFFRVAAGEMRGPQTLSLDDKVSNPTPLDQQIRQRLDSIGPDANPRSFAGDAAVEAAGQPAVSPAVRRSTSSDAWEHLSLLARWYYSSFRDGEIIMLPPSQEIPHAKMIRVCRKILATAP